MEQINIIGVIQSPLKEIADCPLQENEDAPQATIVIDSQYKQGMIGLEPGARIVILTWLHKSDRKILSTKPRNNPMAETLGVFATRSPDRPNPIGIHTTEIVDISALGEITVSSLEVLDGTPVIDIKPYWS